MPQTTMSDVRRFKCPSCRQCYVYPYITITRESQRIDGVIKQTGRVMSEWRFSCKSCGVSVTIKALDVFMNSRCGVPDHLVRAVRYAKRKAHEPEIRRI